MISTLLLIFTTFLSSILSYGNAGRNGGRGGRGVVGQYDCLNYRQCARTTITMESNIVNVNCYGYQSCYGSKISTPATIGCQGLAGCENTAMNTESNVICGAAGCRNATIYANDTVYCNDEYSCFNSTLNSTAAICNSHLSCTFNTMSNAGMFCNGNSSCYRARAVVSRLFVYGYRAMAHSHSFCNNHINNDYCEFRGRSYYGFFNSSVVSNGIPDMYIHLEVSYSGFGLRVICQMPSTCHIICYCATCCLNVSVHTDGNATYNETWASLDGLSAEETKAKYSTIEVFELTEEYPIKPYQPIDYNNDPMFDFIVKDINKKNSKYKWYNVYQIKHITYGVIIASVIYAIAFFIFYKKNKNSKLECQNEDYEYQIIY